MGDSGDLMQQLGLDMSVKVLMHLDSPYDLLRFSSVSRGCYRFVMAHGLCKQLCLKMFPEISSVTHTIEDQDLIQPLGYRPEASSEWEQLERNHKVYSFLAHGLSPSVRTDCIAEAICASSTDNFPEESVKNTLEPNDKEEQRASYWSSKGEADATIPETLIYKLKAKLCVVTEIHVQPLKAIFQFGAPIYSAKAVRFRLGHYKYPMETDNVITDDLVAEHRSTAGKFTWTYTSPEFPMIQENCLQKFELPEPVLCIGGVVQVELLGRLQQQEMDNLFYICVSHVQVVGRPLSQQFSVKILHDSGKCALTYHCPKADRSPIDSSENESGSPSHLHMLTSGLMERGIWGWKLLQTFLSSVAVGIGEESADEHVS